MLPVSKAGNSSHDDLAQKDFLPHSTSGLGQRLSARVQVEQNVASFVDEIHQHQECDEFQNTDDQDGGLAPVEEKEVWRKRMSEKK